MKYFPNYDDKTPTRAAFGEEMVELGKERPEIFVVDCDIAKSCGTTRFSKELPDQHVNVGIAEQNGAGVAAGLATTGKIPFVVTYAVFGSLRMGEQIRQSICYPKLKLSTSAANAVAQHLSCKTLPKALQKHHVLPETQLRTLATCIFP